MTAHLITPTSFSARVVLATKRDITIIVGSTREFGTHSDASGYFSRRLMPFVLKGKIRRPRTRHVQTAQLTAHFEDYRDTVIAELYGYADLHDIFWASRPKGAKPLRFQIFPDFGGGCIWNEGGGGTSVAAHFPGNEKVRNLEITLRKEWQPRFEVALDFDPAEAHNLDWPSFHAQGEELSIRLKEAVGDEAEIIYMKPLEDPNCCNDEFKLAVLT